LPAFTFAVFMKTPFLRGLEVLAKIAERTGWEGQAQWIVGWASSKGGGKAPAPASANENLGASFFQEIRQGLQARRNPAMPSGLELVISGGTQPVGKDAVAWATQCQELGAGLILPTGMDGDGTLAGYDLEFPKAIASAVDLPVVASGGAGTLEHFYEGVVRGGAQILLAASVFHFRTLSTRQVKEYLRSRGNIGISLTAAGKRSSDHSFVVS
jgi:hypothetical protein